MRENLNWAVLGTGVIANEMAVALQKNGRIFTRSATGPMRRRLLLRRNMELEKFTMISMRCLPIRRSMSFISDAAQHASWLYERGDCQWKTHSTLRNRLH